MQKPQINIFSKLIIISQLAFTCSYSKQLNQKKILIGVSARICYANFEQVIPDEMYQYIISQKHLQNPIKHLSWSFLRKQLMVLSNQLFLQKFPSQIFHRFLNIFYLDFQNKIFANFCISQLFLIVSSRKQFQTMSSEVAL